MAVATEDLFAAGGHPENGGRPAKEILFRRSAPNELAFPEES